MILRNSLGQFKKGSQAGKGCIPKNRLDIPKQWLCQKYIIEKLPLWKLAELQNCCSTTIWNYLIRNNIKTRTNGEAQRGCPRSKEVKEKISRANKISLLGNIPWNTGKKCSKISNALKKWHKKNPDARKGKDSPCWKGGISRLPYSFEFNKKLKQRIRKRDNFICQFCGALENNKGLPIHHIDYDKENSNDNNFITLCYSCNVKANYHRNKWGLLFSTLNEIRITK